MKPTFNTVKPLSKIRLNQMKAKFSTAASVRRALTYMPKQAPFVQIQPKKPSEHGMLTTGLTDIFKKIITILK